MMFQRSKDAGGHWERPEFRFNARPIELERGADDDRGSRIRFIFSAANPQQPTTIYGCFERVIIRDVVDHWTPGLYISFDGGNNWSLLTELVQNKKLEEACPVGVSPSNPNIMIAHGQTSVIITRDGGRNWHAVGGWADLEKPAELEGYAANLSALHEKGLSPSQQWPFDWTYLRVLDISFKPDNSDVAFLVTNKGIFRTLDGAHSWCLLNTGSRKLFDVRNIDIDPSHPDRVFVGTSFKLLVSDDLGCHFRTLFDWTKYKKTSVARGASQH